jgi:hypothetical protein
LPALLLARLSDSRVDGSGMFFAGGFSMPKKFAAPAVAALLRVPVVACLTLAVSFVLTRMVTMSLTCAALILEEGSRITAPQ